MAEEIRAEMVANVWKVVASAGDSVVRGRHAGDPRVDEDGDPGARRVRRHGRAAGRQRGRRRPGGRPDRGHRMIRVRPAVARRLRRDRRADRRRVRRRRPARRRPRLRHAPARRGDPGRARASCWSPSTPPVLGSVTVRAARVGVRGDRAPGRGGVPDAGGRRRPPRAAAWAELLARACIARAEEQGCQAVVICVRDIGAAARRLYDRIGFARIPERDWSPYPGVLLLALRLDLSDPEARTPPSGQAADARRS